MASWGALLHTLIGTELPERDYSERLAELIKLLRDDCTPIIKLVEALGPFLTTDEDPQRARATSVLAEVVEAVPSLATAEGEVRHLTEFFSSRLTDWPCARGALRGCLALLSRHPAAGSTPAPPAPQELPIAQVDDALVVEMMRVCVGHVFIRALSHQDRTLALRLLTAAMRGYGDALLAANLDLFEYLVSSVDGEKDPRCLLLCFEAARCLLELYHRQPDTSLCHDALENGAEELFEVLACYFPVTFTPPPNDPYKISRDDLAAALEGMLAAEPLFAPFLVPLACEKLGSTLRQAKLDALSLIGACAESYGPATLADHVGTLWSALRPELAAPAAVGLLPADAPAAMELADAAAARLARCVAAFQGGSRGGGAETRAAGAPPPAQLTGLVLGDASLDDLLACVAQPGLDAATHRRSVLRAQAGARAAEALCRAGGEAAGRALGQLLPPLLARAAAAAGEGGGSESWQVQCLAWSAVSGLVTSAAAAVQPVSLSDANAAAVQQAVAAAACALTAAAQSGAEPIDGDEAQQDAKPGTTPQQALHAARWPLLPFDCSQQRASILQLATLAAIFTSPLLAAQLPTQDVETATSSVLSALLAGRSASAAVQHAAAAALAALASSTHASLLADNALPQLVSAAGQPDHAAAALAALQALAAASSALHLEVVLALDLALQQQLPAALTSSGSPQLLQQLLQAATRVVRAGPEAGSAEPAAAAPSLQLVQHLLEAAEALPAAQQCAAVGPQLLTACAELAFHSVRGVSAEQQLPLAAHAAESILEQSVQRPAELSIVVSCALLVPLRCEAVAALAGRQPLADIVERAVQVALNQQEPGPPGHWAALAVAALLNKWPATDATGLAVCLEALLHQHLYPACNLAANGAAGHPSQLPAAAPVAWDCLAALTRALAMRGSKEADGVVTLVIDTLHTAAQQYQHLQAESGTGESASSELAAGVQCAARFLGAVLDGGDGGGTSAGVNKQAHAVARPLWQQRLFTTALAQLQPLLLGSLQTAASGEPPQPLPSPVLLLALAQLLCAAPASVVQQDRRRLLPWMLQCLQALQQSQLGDAQLTHAVLLLISDALMSEEGRKQAEAELLPRLIPVLLALAAYRASPAVRETALECLLLLVELPYTALHPYRRQVAHVLAAAVDDPRRAVRQQAARCRQAWTA